MHGQQQKRHAAQSSGAATLPKRHQGILDSEIPLGGRGRRLTANECRKLRERGVACDERYVVVRVAVDTPRLGHLYEPVYTAEGLVGVGVMLG
ncbi:MAG: hypothetical protein M0015_05120 [Betaproteobacteria bacterium]|nr:hypothetical protein [Betaproteobacteria bacterium]